MLFLVLVLVWILTFIIPPGTYSYVSCDAGSPKPIPGTYHSITVNRSVQERLYDLWVSPVNGLYGIRTPSEVIPDPSPELLKKGQAACRTAAGTQVSAEIVTAPRGTPDLTTAGTWPARSRCSSSCWRSARSSPSRSGPGRWMRGSGGSPAGFRERGLLLIVILMVIFSVGGTTYGMAEETLGFYAIILPVIIGLGYDRMVGVGIIMVGAGVGTLASTVNPFATGVASDAAGSPWAMASGLLKLSTFMGHVDPASTAVYLTITAELTDVAADRFQTFAAPISIGIRP